MSERHILKEMWGGVAVAELSSEDRVGPLHITTNAGLLFRAARRASTVKSLTKRVRTLARSVK